MNRQEFEEAARRYREEMFRLYAERQLNPPPAPPPAPPPSRVPHHPPSVPPVQIPPRPTRMPPPPVPQRGVLPALSDGEGPAAADPLPEPDIAGAPADSVYLPENPPQEPEPVPESEAGAVKPESDGGILVHVRTARGAEPVPGAAVLITQEQNGEQVLIAVRTADDCGDVPEVRVPAPPSSADQQYPAYYVYDITVAAEGFYRERSTDVPVFEGIVSVQSFDLIPLPAGHDDPYTGSRTHYNHLPGR